MSLVRVVRSDARQAGSLLARAFHRDALLVHMLPDENERTRLAPDHFERVVRLALCTGEIWRTERFDGVACWIAPGRWPATSAEEEDAGLYEIPVIVGAEAWERFHTVYAAMDHAHGRVLADPHWVLPLIGVEPGKQGSGLGSMLLRPLLERADNDGKTCYLETLNEANLEFYARHGFQVAIDEVEPVSGLRYWCCIRPPACGAQPAYERHTDGSRYKPHRDRRRSPSSAGRHEPAEARLEDL